jgi:LPXTG-motif cell wall-anchored protein
MRTKQLTGILLILGLFSLFGQSAIAQTSTGTFTLPPGATATISFEAFCTNFGQKFPLSIQTPNARAIDKIQSALMYIQRNNLASDPTKALEAQYAIWQLSGATNSPAGGTDAQAIVAAATTAPAASTGTSIVEAAQANQVTVTLASWQPIGNKVQLGAAMDNFYGRGTLTVVNTSKQTLTLAFPVGMLFPPATAGEQTMAGYATKVDVSKSQTAQAPQQLPNTGGESDPIVLITGALLMLSVGIILRQNRAVH